MHAYDVSEYKNRKKGYELYNQYNLLSVLTTSSLSQIHIIWDKMKNLVYLLLGKQRYTVKISISIFI